MGVNDVMVTRIAARNSLGESLDSMWPRLFNGESAVANLSRFSTDQVQTHMAACIDTLDYGSEKNQTCILLKSVLDAIGSIPGETLVIWAGVKSDVEYIERHFRGEKAEPFYLPQHYREWICDYVGVDPSHGLEVNSACASSSTAMALGAEMILSGDEEHVLVCAADLVSRFTFFGFAALKALSPTVCRPFDKTRDGLVLGDGAGAVLLSGRDAAEKKGMTPLAKLAGWSTTNDANHITGPARDGCGLSFAIQKALQVASIEADKIAAYCAHGTGTVYNDAMELTAIDTMFGDQRFPVYSVKGAIGHTLGAAGVIEAALSVRSLNEQRVPPTAGMQEVEPRGEGRVSTKEQAVDGCYALSSNSGFGGVNSALVFEAI